MADRMRVTSVILASLPRGGRRVSLGGGRRLARFGHLDLRSEAEFASALKSDTPPRVVERNGRRLTWLRSREPAQTRRALVQVCGASACREGSYTVTVPE